MLLLTRLDRFSVQALLQRRYIYVFQYIFYAHAHVPL